MRRVYYTATARTVEMSNACALVDYPEERDVLQEIRFEVMKLIQMARDAVKRLDFVNTKINSQVT
jgi:hypothetical protein